MRTFRPAAASLSLGCREFNLCCFLVWNSCAFLCVFFSLFIPSHLCGFSFAIFLIFTSCLRFCLCLCSSSSSSFSCLLALCFFANAGRECNIKTAWSWRMKTYKRNSWEVECSPGLAPFAKYVSKGEDISWLCIRDFLNFGSVFRFRV